MRLHLAIPALLAITMMASGLHRAANAGEDKHSHGHSEHAAAATALSLDNGDKWLMDEHTRNKMTEMEGAFYSADHGNQASLNTLGMRMSQDVEELVAGCTMQGKAHEQLHVFLTDYIPTVQAMSSADTLESARANAIKLKGQLDNYKKHFK